MDAAAWDAWYDLCAQVVRQQAAWSEDHAGIVWQQRRADPICPHAVVLLYRDPETLHPPRYRLRTATRIMHDEPTTADLLAVLSELAAVTRRRRHEPGYDPRPALTQVQERMSPHAEYIGVAVSTLNTPAGAWTDLRDRVRSEDDLPGMCYIVLADRTYLRLHRDARSRGAAQELAATITVPLATQSLMSQHLLDQDGPDRLVWQQLWHLHEQIGGHP
ncbi:hypothetical protein [Dactylosporangium salmoneum]|uniref:Uncharacterized protein n=1 Tax=Dactylosporangium salmoneum TaxID=53361 RepID=A0ABN3GHB0_9ACTN